VNECGQRCEREAGAGRLARIISYPAIILLAFASPAFAQSSEKTPHLEISGGEHDKARFRYQGKELNCAAVRALYHGKHTAKDMIPFEVNEKDGMKSLKLLTDFMTCSKIPAIGIAPTKN